MAALALLATLALPALAGAMSRSQVVQCLNNLRLVGRGLQSFNNGVGVFPWRIPPAGGGGGTPAPGNAWIEYSVLSNELVTPRILACPADSGVLVASNFSQYTTASFRASATSYLINLHASPDYPSAPTFADRNFRVTSAAVSCSLTALNNLFEINAADQSAGWTNLVHGFQGNVVTTDGSVSTTTTEDFRRALAKSELASARVHIMKAR